MENYTAQSDWWCNMPPWATGLAQGEFVVGAQLCTKDGRRVGNGVVVAIEEHPALGTLYRVLTDAGNSFAYTTAEIVEAYHPPQFVMDVVGSVPWRAHLNKVEFEGATPYAVGDVILYNGEKCAITCAGAGVGTDVPPATP